MEAVRIAHATACRLGEGAVWDTSSQRLIYTDIEGSVLHAYTPADSSHRSWPMPDRVGSFALTAVADRLLLGLAGGVALFDLGRGMVDGMIPVEADEPRTRINDGRCDAQGRFVFGMYNPQETPVGRWHRVDGRSGRLRVETLNLPAVAVANATTFSPDGRTMYFTDSPRRMIWCADYPAEGEIGPVREFADLGDEAGFPDGGCVDAQGHLWVALWDGACVLEIDRSGRKQRRIALPARRPTCPAFGGPELSTLYCTSARSGLESSEGRVAEAQGALLAVESMTSRGIPERRFGAV